MNLTLVFIVSVILTLEAATASTLRRMTPLQHEQNELFEEDYDDFSEVPQFLRQAYNIPKSVVSDQKLADYLLPSPRKRYRESRISQSERSFS